MIRLFVGTRGIIAPITLAIFLLLVGTQTQAQIAVRGVSTSIEQSQVGVSPTYRSDTSADTGSSPETSLTLTRPSGVVADDVLIAQISITSDTANISAPPDWILLDNDVYPSSTSLQQAIYYRVATASTPSNFTWTFNEDVRAAGGVQAFFNVETSDPIDLFGVRQSSGSTISLPTITTTSSRSLLVALLANQRGSSSISTPSGMTERYDESSGAGGAGITVSGSTQFQTNAGSTGTKTASGSNEISIAHLLSLRLRGDAEIPVPLATQPGDVLVVTVTTRPCSTSNGGACTTNITAPAGWTLIQSVNQTRGAGTDGYGVRVSSYFRVADGTEPPSYTWRIGGTPVHAGALGVMVAFSGVDTTNPIISSGANFPNTYSNTHTSPSISVGSVANSMLVGAYVVNSSGVWAPQASMTERADIATRSIGDALGVSMSVATELLPGTGNTGTRSATMSGAPNDTGVGMITALRPAVASFTHLLLQHDGSALSCALETITVRACANAACSAFDTAGVSGNVTAGGNSVPFAIPAGQSQTTVNIFLPSDTALPDPQTVRLGTSGVSRVPSDSASPYCQINAGAVNNTTACDVSVFKAGFIFDVPDLTAGLASAPVSVRAVQSNNSNNCVPLFQNVTRTVSLWGTRSNPATGTLPLRVNNTAIETTATPAYTSNFNLAFNASGTATLNDVRYDDVGLMQLSARYVGSAATSDTGLIVRGSDSFVVSPASFALSIAGNPAAADASGAVFRRAGESFTVQVTALNALGAATPNFGQESVAESVGLASQLFQPVGGNNPALVAVSPFGAFTNGVASGTFRWDEVGIINLLPSILDSNYLGAGNVSGPLSPNVGRFRAARLAITANVPSLQNACLAGGFSYQGEEFPFVISPQFTVRGLNMLGGTTLNYDGSYFKLAGTLSGRSYANLTAGTASVLSRTTDGGNATVSGTAAPPYDGTGVLSVIGDRMTYGKTIAPEAPFDASMSMLLPVADLTDADTSCYDPDNNGVCDPFTLTPINGGTQRWGRLAVGNAYGPELLDLNVSVRTEYFDGTSFVQHAADTCSLAGTVTLIDVDAGDSLLPAHTCVLDTGSPGVSGLGCAAPAPLTQRYSSVPTAGAYTLWLQAPGANRTGLLDLRINAPSWLEYNWGGLGIRDPSSRVGFGQFAGDRRQIYEREVY